MWLLCIHEDTKVYLAKTSTQHNTGELNNKYIHLNINKINTIIRDENKMKQCNKRQTYNLNE